MTSDPKTYQAFTKFGSMSFQRRQLLFFRKKTKKKTLLNVYNQEAQPQMLLIFPKVFCDKLSDDLCVKNSPFSPSKTMLIY